MRQTRQRHFILYIYIVACKYIKAMINIIRFGVIVYIIYDMYNAIQADLLSMSIYITQRSLQNLYVLYITIKMMFEM